MNPTYYAIIPADVRYAKITPNAKLLYGEITALTNKEGFCWASNKYFADLYQVSSTSISLWVKELVNAGFISYEIDLEKGNFRKIYLRNLKDPIKENLKTSLKKLKDPSLKNLKDNNTSINNTINDYKEYNKKTIEEFFQNSDLKELIQKKLIPYENQIWFTEQADITISFLKEKMLEYYTENSKGQKKEIKNIKNRFYKFLESYKRADFYKYVKNDSIQQTGTPEPESKTIDRSKYTTQVEFDYDLNWMQNRFGKNLKVINND